MFCLVGDFVSVSECSACCSSRFVKSKGVVVFPRNKKVCIGRSVGGSFLSMQTLVEKEGIVTETGFEFPISLMVGRAGPCTIRFSGAGIPVFGGALASCDKRGIKTWLCLHSQQPLCVFGR